MQLFNLYLNSIYGKLNLKYKMVLIIFIAYFVFASIGVSNAEDKCICWQ